MSDTASLAPWIADQARQLLAQRGHAWLLQGPSGLGQYELALALVRSWLCDAPDAQGACGQCPDCQPNAPGGVSRNTNDENGFRGHGHEQADCHSFSRPRDGRGRVDRSCRGDCPGSAPSLCTIFMQTKPSVPSLQTALPSSLPEGRGLDGGIDD